MAKRDVASKLLKALRKSSKVVEDVCWNKYGGVLKKLNTLSANERGWNDEWTTPRFSKSKMAEILTEMAEGDSDGVIEQEQNLDYYVGIMAAFKMMIEAVEEEEQNIGYEFDMEFGDSIDESLCSTVADKIS